MSERKQHPGADAALIAERKQHPGADAAPCRRGMLVVNHKWWILTRSGFWFRLEEGLLPQVPKLRHLRCRFYDRTEAMVKFSHLFSHGRSSTPNVIAPVYYRLAMTRCRLKKFCIVLSSLHPQHLETVDVFVMSDLRGCCVRTIPWCRHTEIGGKQAGTAGS